MKKYIRNLTICLTTILVLGITPVFAEEPELPVMPGTVEGTGVSFQVTDSQYLNVTLQSTIPVTVRLESVAKMILMSFEAGEGGTAQITLGGLAPSTTYYKHQDSYSEGGAITTDANGLYSWTQDVSTPHHVWLQTNPSTKYIRDDATGGDCTAIGVWDATTKTCTLTGNVSETIEIQSNNVTLDGAGHSNVGVGTGNGVYLYLRTGVTIKNVRVQHFYRGISLVSLGSTSNTTLTGNTVSNNYIGISLSGSSNNTLTGNTASNNYFGIYLARSSNNTLTGNTVLSNNTGIIFARSANNTIYNNNYIDNSTQVTSMRYNVFSLAPPIGGNYYSNWTSPDIDGDGFVDVPYVVAGGQDNLPWTRPNGWLNQAPVADAGVNIQIPSASLAYTMVQGSATDPEGDPLQYRWLEGETVILDWAAIGENGAALLDLALVPQMAIGNHTLTLEVADGTHTAKDTMVLTIDNSPPEVQPAPNKQVVEFALNPIKIMANVSDFDGDEVSYEWLLNGNTLASGKVQTVPGGTSVAIPALEMQPGDSWFPLGTHMVELKVSDTVNDPVSGVVSVEVKDTSAPSLSPQPSITMLWPPNHTLQPVTIQANASDKGGGAITLAVRVGSSELPDLDGSGNTIPDFSIDSVNDATGLIQLQLRSERAGKGDGRTYTIAITATDTSGNHSDAYLEIKAPHDKSRR